MALNDLVDSFCYSQKNAGLKGLIINNDRRALCYSINATHVFDVPINYAAAPDKWRVIHGSRGVAFFITVYFVFRIQVIQSFLFCCLHFPIRKNVHMLLCILQSLHLTAFSALMEWNILKVKRIRDEFRLD